MVTIRSVNEIILNLIDFFKIAQPNLDTKPGTVARDLAIDGPANQLALLYDEVSKVSTQQSLRLVLGSDLDKLAKNFGLTRKGSTFSTGVGLLTFSSIPSTININKGGLITAGNGFSFAVVNGLSVVPSQLNFYKSIATKYQNDLAFVGITDQYAVQVSLQSTTAGSSGDIPKYSLSRTNIPGVSNVTNANPFIGGNDQEDDAAFRNRILSIFSGSSIGTALGYKNVALATTGVTDAFVVEPGSPLMTRDGSEVTSDSLGNLTIVSEGTGGKVDVVILGSNLVKNTDSFIYRDLSNNNDPTSSKNIIVLGQITGDTNKTFNQKRIADIAAGTVPAQPVDALVQVTGSSSGSNFQEKSVDSFGRVTGNYELIKDTGVYGGSPWGFDSFHWINNNITFNEDRIKSKFGGQDAVTFSDVLEIPQVQQNISITNENSNVVTSDRSLIQLLHTPATAVTRVFNVNTGERYTVVSQNPNGNGSTNTSGVIKISGSTLPSQSDVLQVDYNWVITYDQYADYDGRSLTNNPRPVTDSTDWGYSNLIRTEKVNFTKNGSGTFFTGTTSLPITSVVTASTFDKIDGYVTTVASGTFTGRLAFVINNLFNATTSVDHVYFKNSTIELYNTAQNNGTFSNVTIVVGITLEYVTTIILPTDTKAVQGDKITAVLNTTDVFNNTNSAGNFSGNQLTIPAANLTTPATNIILNTAYIANVQNIISTSITTVPLSRLGNGFSTNNSNGFNNLYVNNTTRKENQTIQKNLSNQFYVELNLSSLDASLIANQIISVIRLSDGLEVWNQDFNGTITTNTSTNNYQLIFGGHNTPALGDRVLVIYYATDTQRSQPFTFANKIYDKVFGTLQYNAANNTFLTGIHIFATESPVTFQILEPNTDIVLATATDGVLTNASMNASLANFTSSTVNFANILDASSQKINILFKKIRFLNCSHVNNSNTFDILSYNVGTNTISLANDYSKISNSQISITRISDGQELWSNAGTIDTVNNLLVFPATDSAASLDKVYITYSNESNLRQTPTRLTLNITDQVVNTGTLSVVGTTITKASNIVFASTNSSLKQNLLSAIRLALGLNSNAAIPANVKLVKIAKLERVTTTNSTSNDVLLVNSTYDVFGTTINDNSFFADSFVKDTTLGNFDFVLPTTINNTTNLTTQATNGDKFRITFYYSTTNDLENVIFTRNGTLYTNKSYALIDKVYISSGFNASKSAKLTIGNFNQPVTGSRYTVFYNYIAPKQNERIIVQYNYNKLISDTTFNIENNRPINADILVREAKAIDLDVTINVVITTQFLTSSALVLQNLKDKLIATINSNGLGSSIDSSTLINAAFSVDGVGGARIQFFNKTGSVGTALSIQAHDDQYFVANNITVNQVAT